MVNCNKVKAKFSVVLLLIIVNISDYVYRAAAQQVNVLYVFTCRDCAAAKGIWCVNNEKRISLCLVAADGSQTVGGSEICGHIKGTHDEQCSTDGFTFARMPDMKWSPFQTINKKNCDFYCSIYLGGSLFRFCFDAPSYYCTIFGGTVKRTKAANREPVKPVLPEHLPYTSRGCLDIASDYAAVVETVYVWCVIDTTRPLAACIPTAFVSILCAGGTPYSKVADIPVDAPVIRRFQLEYGSAATCEQCVNLRQAFWCVGTSRGNSAVRLCLEGVTEQAAHGLCQSAYSDCNDSNLKDSDKNFLFPATHQSCDSCQRAETNSRWCLEDSFGVETALCISEKFWDVLCSSSSHGIDCSTVKQQTSLMPLLPNPKPLIYVESDTLNKYRDCGACVKSENVWCSIREGVDLVAGCLARSRVYSECRKGSQNGRSMIVTLAGCNTLPVDQQVHSINSLLISQKTCYECVKRLQALWCVFVSDGSDSDEHLSFCTNDNEANILACEKNGGKAIRRSGSNKCGDIQSLRNRELKLPALPRSCVECTGNGASSGHRWCIHESFAGLTRFCIKKEFMRLMCGGGNVFTDCTRLSAASQSMHFVATFNELPDNLPLTLKACLADEIGGDDYRIWCRKDGNRVCMPKSYEYFCDGGSTIFVDSEGLSDEERQLAWPMDIRSNCESCIESGNGRWCSNALDMKINFCISNNVDEPTVPFCKPVTTDCRSIPHADGFGSILPQRNTCEKCLGDAQPNLLAWCIHVSLGFATKFCVDSRLAPFLCRNGSIYKDCSQVAANGRYERSPIQPGPLVYKNNSNYGNKNDRGINNDCNSKGSCKRKRRPWKVQLLLNIHKKSKSNKVAAVG